MRVVQAHSQFFLTGTVFLGPRLLPLTLNHTLCTEIWFVLLVFITVG